MTWCLNPTLCNANSVVRWIHSPGSVSVRLSVTVPAPVTTPLPKVVGMSLLAAGALAGTCTFPRGSDLGSAHCGGGVGGVGTGGNSGIIGI